MADKNKPRKSGPLTRAFLKGLSIVLPAIITIALFAWVWDILRVNVVELLIRGIDAIDVFEPRDLTADERLHLTQTAPGKLVLYETWVRDGMRPQENRLTIADLYFATSNLRKRQMYEQILNTELQIAALNLEDIQHVDAGEVALKKVQQAYDILRKPVFVDHSSLAIRAWGGFPGGLTTSFIVPVGLNNICKMLQPFDDRYAESISVIAFQDGYLRRKFVGVVPGEIPPEPRGEGYSWNNIFIPGGFSKTLGEMTEAEMVSISSRRRAMIEFMRFLQANYELV